MCHSYFLYTKKRYPLFDSRPPNPLPTTFMSPLPPGKFFCYRCHSYFLFTKNGILFLILVPPTPSPLLSCLPSHLASSSVRGAIHTSYMKKNSIFVKENYKSAKCNIAFELKRLLVSQKRIHLLTEAENVRDSRPEWLIPRCISTSYHTMVSPKNLSQITALNHEWVMGSWLLIINLNSPPCREVHLTETRP